MHASLRLLVAGPKTQHHISLQHQHANMLLRVGDAKQQLPDPAPSRVSPGQGYSSLRDCSSLVGMQPTPGNLQKGMKTDKKVHGGSYSALNPDRKVCNGS